MMLRVSGTPIGDANKDQFYLSSLQARNVLVDVMRKIDFTHPFTVTEHPVEQVQRRNMNESQQTTQYFIDGVEVDITMSEVGDLIVGATAI